MPDTPQQSGIIVTANQLRGITIGAGAVMTTIGVSGLVAALATDDAVPTAHTIAVACLSGLLVLGLLVLTLTTLRGLAAVIHHQNSIKRATLAHFDSLGRHQNDIEAVLTAHLQQIERMIDAKTDHVLQRRVDQLSEILAAVHETTQLQASVIGDVIEKQLTARDDELARYRRARRGL